MLKLMVGILTKIGIAKDALQLAASAVLALCSPFPTSSGSVEMC